MAVNFQNMKMTDLKHWRGVLMINLRTAMNQPFVDLDKIKSTVDSLIEIRDRIKELS